MIEKQATFFSEGSKLQATLYYPEAVSDGTPRPALIINSGYQGFNEFYPKMFAKLMTQYGYICLGFDYRGMADSEGPKGRVLIEEQVVDIRNAITFMQTQDDVDDSQIGLIGWGMGAANVVLAAEKAQNIAAVAPLNGFYKGDRWLKSIHSETEWTSLLEDVRVDRIKRVLEGESRLGETFEHYPLDPATDDYVQKELAQVYGFGHPTCIQFTESILDLNVEKAVANLEGIPLFIGHGINNALHPFAEAEGLNNAAVEPKTFYSIEGRHNDFMYVDHPVFVELCQRLNEFFTQSFVQNSTKAQSVTA